MSTSKIREGDIVQYLAGSAIASGDVVVIGNRVGIAIADIANGSSGAVEMEGCYSVTKVSAQAWAAGDEIFWDASDAKFTTVGTANTFAGHAMDIAANPTSTGNLRLSPGYKKATVIAALGTTSNLSALSVTATTIAASNFTAASAPEPTKAEVDAGIDTLKTAVVTALDLKADNADVETLRTQAESRLDAIEAKIDAFIAAQKVAGQMANA